MRLFDIFKKKGDEDTSGRDERISDIKALEMYSGMRVVVETPEEQMLFIAKLEDLKGSKARLRQYSDADTEEDLDLYKHVLRSLMKIQILLCVRI